MEPFFFIKIREKNMKIFSTFDGIVYRRENPVIVQKDQVDHPIPIP